MSKKPYFILALTFSLVPYSKLQAAGVCPETLCSRCECIGDGVVRETDKMYDGDIIHTYDIYGREISAQNNLEGRGYGTYTTYTYDSNGHRTSSTSYQDYDFEHPERNTPTEYHIWTYDANGNKTSETHSGYDRYGNPSPYQFQYTYDANGRVVSETEYNGLSAEQTVYYYERDDDKYWQTSTTYDIKSNPPVLENSLSYNCGNKVVTTTPGAAYCDHMYTYFQNGEMSEQNVYADHISHGNFNIEESRDCKRCNCCESVTTVPPTTVAAYNPNPDIVCATGYAPSCSIGDGSQIQNNTNADSRPVRKIYTVEEAEKVSKKTGNTFKLRYK